DYYCCSYTTRGTYVF
nr:immunoglobulin light chain junction region [Macaca mulatta]MOW01697.1 immunoglobulin light chain junction region [Macaca mulatta]